MMETARQTIDAIGDPFKMATVGSQSRHTGPGSDTNVAEKVDQFVSKEAGHLLGNAQDTLGPKVSHDTD